MIEKFKILCTADRFNSRTGWRFSVVTNDDEENLVNSFEHELDAKSFIENTK